MLESEPGLPDANLGILARTLAKLSVKDVSRININLEMRGAASFSEYNWLIYEFINTNLWSRIHF